MAVGASFCNAAATSGPLCFPAGPVPPKLPASTGSTWSLGCAVALGPSGAGVGGGAAGVSGAAARFCFSGPAATDDLAGAGGRTTGTALGLGRLRLRPMGLAGSGAADGEADGGGSEATDAPRLASATRHASTARRAEGAKPARPESELPELRERATGSAAAIIGSAAAVASGADPLREARRSGRIVGSVGAACSPAGPARFGTVLASARALSPLPVDWPARVATAGNAGSALNSASMTNWREETTWQPAFRLIVTTGSLIGTVDRIRNREAPGRAPASSDTVTLRSGSRVSPCVTSACRHRSPPISPASSVNGTVMFSGLPIRASPRTCPMAIAAASSEMPNTSKMAEIWRSCGIMRRANRRADRRAKAEGRTF